MAEPQLLHVDGASEARLTIDSFRMPSWSATELTLGRSSFSLGIASAFTPRESPFAKTVQQSHCATVELSS